MSINLNTIRSSASVSASSSMESAFESLPNEILTRIAFHCDISGTARLACTSKWTRDVAMDHSVWRIFAKHIGCPIEQNEDVRIQAQSFIQDTLARARSIGMPVPSVPTLDEVKNLLDVLDVFTFWEELANAIGTPVPDWKTAKASEFGNWCEQHQSQLAQITTLSILSKKLTSLPKEIGLLTQLKKLKLDDNYLSSLPKEIVQLTQLQFLCLNTNKFKVLSPEIGQLSELLYLGLSSNQLASVPPQIGQLSKLKKLYLVRNKLTEVPSAIKEMTGCDVYLDLNPLLLESDSKKVN